MKGIFGFLVGRIINSRIKTIPNFVDVVNKTKLVEEADLNLGDEGKYYEFHESVQIPFLNELYIQIFGKRNDGICIEVGAYDGITCSNSLGLAK